MGDWKGRMDKTVRLLVESLRGIRTGTLSIGFLETFRVPVQGSSVPIGRLARFAGQGDRILVTPFDPALVGTIAKALSEAKLGAYALDRATVCVGVPPISGEGRAELARHVKKLGEETKVAIRSIRQDTRKRIAALGRGSERAVQEATDAAVAEVERLVKAKLGEIGA